MSNGHTPGPWIARKAGGAGWPGQRGWAIDYNEDQEQVVDFVYEEADAHLIAAAPDLYKHAEALLADVMQRYGIAADGLTCPHMRGLAEAIAKARGTPC